MRFARDLTPPYYAVIFASTLREPAKGYETMADRMAGLAQEMDGYLGIESARDPEGLGITISYWRDEACIAAWKQRAEHLAAQDAGMKNWYEHYELRVARVERSYSGPEGRKDVKDKSTEERS